MSTIASPEWVAAFSSSHSALPILARVPTTSSSAWKASAGSLRNAASRSWRSGLEATSNVGVPSALTVSSTSAFFAFLGAGAGAGERVADRVALPALRPRYAGPALSALAEHAAWPGSSSFAPSDRKQGSSQGSGASCAGGT